MSNVNIVCQATCQKTKGLCSFVAPEKKLYELQKNEHLCVISHHCILWQYNIAEIMLTF